MSSNCGNTFITYVDESGDPGTSGKSSNTFTLGSISVEASEWGFTLDKLNGFRERLESKFGLPRNYELKANFLIRGNGNLSKLNLSISERALIFRSHLLFLNSLDVRITALVAHKTTLNSDDIFSTAWREFLSLQFKSKEIQNCGSQILVHDESENYQIRQIAKDFNKLNFLSPRRHLLIEEAFARRSDESLFLQFADIVAYSSWRSIYKPTVKVGLVVPQFSWSLLNNAELTEIYL